MSPSDLVLFRNVALDDVATGLQTSTVGEPSVATSGREIYFTGNWYASKSLDDAASWQFVSPFNTLPPAAAGFCCDQLAHYDPSRDLFFWILQYIADDAGANALRIAVKPGSTLQNNTWQWWDFAPTDLDPGWTGEWFDYPDIAVSNSFVWLTTNVFDTSDNWTRAVVLRLDLDVVREGTSLDYDWWTTTEVGSLRLAQGARDTMYFASHNTNRELRVFSWPESSSQVTEATIDVTQWSTGYSAPGPGGVDWLSRCDPRITGAWFGDGVLGVVWTAGPRATRPLPHVRVARVDTATMQLLDEPDIWSTESAYAYPAAAANDRGHVGVTMFYGGGPRHPSHVVGVLDDLEPTWRTRVTRSGTNGPPQGKWGDYLSCRPHRPDGLTWVASGYTLRGGTEPSHVEPRYVHFGRRRDEGAARRWSGA